MEKCLGYSDNLHINTPTGVTKSSIWMFCELLESQGLSQCLYYNNTVQWGLPSDERQMYTTFNLLKAYGLETEVNWSIFKTDR